MNGSIQSFEKPTGFNKYIGTAPVYSDGIGWYTTMAAAISAGISAGDRILIVNGYTPAGTETWAFSNVTIVFMPNQRLTFTVATTRAVYITGSGNKIYDMGIRLNLTLTSGLEISGTDNQVYGVLVESNIAGTTTNAVNLTGSRNIVVGDRLITLGAITNKMVSTVNDSIAIISGTIGLANELIASNIGVSASTVMLNVNGYSRIISPTQSARSAGSEALDFTTQHIFIKTGGTATITISSLAEGQTANLIMVTSGAGYTLTWSPTVIWGPTGKPTPTNATAGTKYDFYTFIKVGGSIFGTVVLAMASAA